MKNAGRPNVGKQRIIFNASSGDEKIQYTQCLINDRIIPIVGTVDHDMIIMVYYAIRRLLNPFSDDNLCDGESPKSEIGYKKNDNKPKNSTEIKPIHVVIASCGGDSEAGIAIHDMLMEARYLGATVETRAYGDASSAASLILACGTPGHRFATSNTVCLVHDVSVEVDADSIMSANDAYEMLTSTLASKQIYAELMAGHTGKTPHEILSDMEHRIVLAGTDLKKYNIVDKVLPAFPAPPKRAKTVKKIKKPKRRKKKK